MGSRVFLWVQIMESQNVMGLDYGSNISEVRPVTLVPLPHPISLGLPITQTN
jgi:hypothetical protein